MTALRRTLLLVLCFALAFVAIHLVRQADGGWIAAALTGGLTGGLAGLLFAMHSGYASPSPRLGPDRDAKGETEEGASSLPRR